MRPHRSNAPTPRSRTSAPSHSRVGHAWDRSLFYVKVGAGWVYEVYQLFDVTAGTTLASASVTRGGWMLGGGFEYGIFGNWTAKIEYDYLAFGTERACSPARPPVRSRCGRTSRWSSSASTTASAGRSDHRSSFMPSWLARKPSDSSKSQGVGPSLVGGKLHQAAPSLPALRDRPFEQPVSESFAAVARCNPDALDLTAPHAEPGETGNERDLNAADNIAARLPRRPAADWDRAPERRRRQHTCC